MHICYALGEGKKFVWKKFVCHFLVYFSSAEAGTQTFFGGFQEAGAPGLRGKEKVCVKKVCVLFRLPNSSENLGSGKLGKVLRTSKNLFWF